MFPDTREQRCWFHKIANALGALPKPAHPGAKKALAEIWNAEDNATPSTFATVRHRTKITRGPGSRAAGLAMAFKLIEAAQDRWRAANAPSLVALVRNGARFENGKLVERPEQQPQPEAA